MLTDLVLLAVGIGLLVKGADWLVDSAERIAVAAGVPIMIVGLTVVAAGTSVPELAVGLDASLGGFGGIVVGDVVGSNIANICLVLGVASLVRPIQVKPYIVNVGIPSIIVVSLLFLFLSFDGTIGRLDGLILLSAAAVYFYGVLRNVKDRSGVEKPRSPGLKSWALMVVGIGVVVTGGKITVDAAVSLATAIGVSPYLIGFTVIAVGTSLPELVTGSIAASKGSGDLVLGDNLGSFCYNALFIAGLCALITPLPVPSILDVVVMGVVAALLVPLILRGFRLDKQEGIFLIALYAAYITYKVLAPGT